MVQTEASVHNPREAGHLQSTLRVGDLAPSKECAHPSGYDPNMNERLGFMSELINRIEKLNTKSI